MRVGKKKGKEVEARLYSIGMERKGKKKQVEVKESTHFHLLSAVNL